MSKEKEKQIIYTIDGIKLPPVNKDLSLPLKFYPDPLLGVPCEKVTWEKDVKQFNDEEIQTLAAQMCNTLYTSVGIGLAAPQIGLPYRIFIYDTEWPNTQKREPHMIINPKITWKSDELQTLREGCLSVALEWHVNVPRAEEVEIEGINLKGEEVKLHASGITAACFQHETDHLDGTLIIDYDGKMRRSLYDKKIIKFARKRRNAYTKMKRQIELQERSAKKIEAAKKRREAREKDGSKTREG